MSIIIGITDTASRYDNYPAWITGVDPAIEIVRLTPGNREAVNRCMGIIFSGGIDSHPRFYGAGNPDYPNAPEHFDEVRDEFELAVFRSAIAKRLPVLAVCRGMQLVNIALGGDLIQDIEAAGKNDHRSHGPIDGIHNITVVPGSLLYETTGVAEGAVNSAHHQALGAIAPDLVVNAWSPDGIAEGAEWKDKADKPFLLCVQWHPERLVQSQPGNPFAHDIRKKFLEAVKNQQALHIN